MAKDYYQILGVAKNANADEIKKAFRQKAHQYHPDKNGGSDAKFKELNEAYQILGSAEKRKQYDQFGSAGFGQGGFGQGGNWEDAMRQSGFGGFSQAGFNVDLGDLGDIFSDMFGFGGTARRRSRRASKGEDIEIEISLEFLEAAFGAEKTITLEKTWPCPECGGSGATPGSASKTCGRCRGEGEIIARQRSILGMIQTRSVCPDCSGAGKVNEKNCPDCAGAGRVRRRGDVLIKIPAGISNGQTIRLSGMGQVGEAGSQSGDLYVRVRVKPDKKFKREDYNIQTTEPITISQAVLGGKISLATIHGEVELKIPAGTHSGKIFKLSGKGVPHLHGGVGDHLVKVEIVIPSKLTKKQKELFSALKESEEKKSSWF